MQRLGENFVPAHEAKTPAHVIAGERPSLDRLKKLYAKGKALGAERRLEEKTDTFLYSVDKQSLSELTDAEAEKLAEILEDIVDREEEQIEFKNKVLRLAIEGMLLIDSLKLAADALVHSREEQKDWAEKIDAYLSAINELCTDTAFSEVCKAMDMPCPIHVLKNLLHWVMGGCYGKPYFPEGVTKWTSPALSKF